MLAFATRPVLTLPQLAQYANGDLVVREVPPAADQREAFLKGGFDGVSIDTRTLVPGNLFVPLPGSQVDGHQFLAAAFERGAAAALCAREHAAALAGAEPGPLVVVDDVTAALQRLAHRFREGWSGVLLGVTGSAGKTTTKDLVAAVLATRAPTLKTKGNLNNHWGVPLTLLELRPEHRAAVVEMGMNQPGEIATLAAIAGPNGAVITNAGVAHLERMGSLEAIAREKASLALALGPSDVVFAGADSPRLIEALAPARCRKVTYGFARGADVRPRRVTPLGAEGSRIEVDGFPPVTLHLIGRHHVANALAAIAVAREYRLDPPQVADALAACRPAGGRMELRTLRGATVLVDWYNANPDSVRAALETLAEFPRAKRRIAILGDMLELGDRAAQLHRETAAHLEDAELWAVGEHARDWVAGAPRGAETRRFADPAEARAALEPVLADGVVVLIKGSRGARLERVLEGIGGD